MRSTARPSRSRPRPPRSPLPERPTKPRSARRAGSAATPVKRSPGNARSDAAGPDSTSPVSARPRSASARPRGLAHLRRSDPVLAGVIAAVGPRLGDARDGRPPDHYGALVRAIVGQQLSTKAARSIFGRLTARFDGRTPTPQEVLADEPEELRAAAGLSRAKVSYLRSLAEHALSGELELERLDELPDEQVISELVAVRGIGEWSAHMFLMFHLQRPDVLPVGDLGIRRAIELAYGLPELPDAATCERIAAPWRPHRTLACRYLWRSLDNEPT